MDGGGFLAADPPSGRVLRFDSLGRSTGSLGRMGDGPGEFRAPTDVAILEDSSVAVVDIQRMQVTILDPAGRYRHAFPTRRLGGHRIAALPGKRIAVAGLYDVGGKNQLLAIYDETGAFLESAVDFPPVIALSSPPIDDAVLAVTSRGSLIFVSAVLPVAWVLEGGKSRQVAFAPPKSWIQLKPMRTSPGRLQEIRDWMGSGSFITAGGLVNDSVLVVGWRNGITTGGPDQLAMVSLERQRMVLVEDAPGRLVGVRGTRVALLVEEGGEANVLAWFTCDATQAAM